MAYFWHTEAARKVWVHSESGGRTSPTPPTKAIAHPFFGHFSAGECRRPDLRALIFGRGCARGLFLAHGVRPQSMGQFRVRRTNFAHAPHQGYSPHVFWPFFRWGVVGAPTFGCSFLSAAVPVAYFWKTEAARKVLGHSDSGGRTSPTPPTKAIAHPFLCHFSAGGCWRPDLR